MVKNFLGEYWLVIVLIIGAFGVGYNQGTESTDKDWAIKWETRNAASADAKAAFELAQREIERGLRDDLAKQLEINDVQRTESQRVKSDADAALVGMHDELGALRLRLQRASDVAGNTGPVSSATRAAMVLSDLFASCSAQRQELAGAFDETRRRALNVEQMYNKARGQ